MTDLICSVLDNGQHIYYSPVQKQSQRGFSMNKRLLLMLQNHYLCYLSSPSSTFPATHDYISKHAKLIVPLKQLTKISYRQMDCKVILQFYLIEKHKKIEKVWTLKMGNQQLLKSWQELLDEYSNRSRNNTMEKFNSVGSRSRTESNYDSTAKLGKQMSRKDSNSQNKMGQEGRLNEIQVVENKFKQFDQLPLQSSDNTPVKVGGNEPILNKLGGEYSNSSYFNNLNLISASPNANTSPVKPALHTDKIKIQQSKIKDRSIYFKEYEANPIPTASSKKYNYKNYYRPYLDTLFQSSKTITSMKQLTQADQKYWNFIQYSTQNVIMLIDSKLQKLKQLQNYKDIKLRIRQNIVNWIKYEDIGDIVIELGLIQLKNVKNDNYICDDGLSKLAMNGVKNSQYLYDVIREDQLLVQSFVIPMGCVVQYKGYTCFVSSKIEPMEDEEYGREEKGRESSKAFDRLASLSKIGFQVFENQKYIKFIPRNKSKSKFIIAHSKTYLPQLQDCLILRQNSFTQLYGQSQQVYVYHGSKKQNQGQMSKISDHLQGKLQKLSQLMNRLQVYPIMPVQMSQILHLFGINVKYLCQLYRRINQSFMQGLIKTEVAVRVFRTILNKKLQQNIPRSRLRNVNQDTAKQLLNIFLGSDETTGLWKVVSLHTQIYFNLPVEKIDINKGYLLMGLSYHMGMQIYNHYEGIYNIFKVNDFVEGVKFHPKVKSPNLLPMFINDMVGELEIPLSQKVFNKVVQNLQLYDSPFPAILKSHHYIYSKILHMLAYYVSPTDHRFPHLKIYQIPSNQFTKLSQLTFFSFHIKLIQIKWQIRNGAQRDYILMLCQKLISIINNYYGKCHPFISQIYQLQSLYFLDKFQEEAAITINKQSLSNMIQCCGDNNRHLKISNNYYQLGECYRSCNRFQQALQNYKKAKNILQINSYQTLPQYAHILSKCGEMYLLSNRDNDAYELFIHAIAIYQKNDLFANWDQLAWLYQSLCRCSYQISGVNKIPVYLVELRLAEHCVTQLERVLSVELQFQLCSDEQFVKLMRVVCQQYINRIRKDDRNMFRDYFLQICDGFIIAPDYNNDPTLSQSIGKFLQLFQNYINDTHEILLRLKNQKRIGKLIPYRRNDLIQNYDYFMRHLIVLLGQAFLLNTIK